MTEPAADGRPATVAHSPAAPLSRPGPHCTLCCTFAFVNIMPSRRTLLTLRVAFCDPVQSARTPTKSPGLGHLRAKRLRSAAHFPPGCAHAIGLLLKHPRAIRCEPSLCGSMIASSHLAGAMPWHLLGPGPLAVAPMASIRHPSPRPRSVPPSGTRISRPPALRAYSQGFRAAPLRYCAAV